MCVKVTEPIHFSAAQTKWVMLEHVLVKVFLRKTHTITHPDLLMGNVDMLAYMFVMFALMEHVILLADIILTLDQ